MSVPKYCGISVKTAAGIACIYSILSTTGIIVSAILAMQGTIKFHTRYDTEISWILLCLGVGYLWTSISGFKGVLKGTEFRLHGIRRLSAFYLFLYCLAFGASVFFFRFKNRQDICEKADGCWYPATPVTMLIIALCKLIFYILHYGALVRYSVYLREKEGPLPK